MELVLLLSTLVSCTLSFPYLLCLPGCAGVTSPSLVSEKHRLGAAEGKPEEAKNPQQRSTQKAIDAKRFYCAVAHAPADTGEAPGRDIVGILWRAPRPCVVLQ